MGPSWVDPRTGEIINTSVRSKKMPKDILDKSLTYVFALANVGGIYLNEYKEGIAVERKKAVDKETQRNSLLWVIKQLRESDWLDNKELLKTFPLSVEKSITLKANVIKKLFSLNDNVLISSQISDNPYTQKDFFNDLYSAIWTPTIKGQKLSQGDKLMQRATINHIMSVADKYLGKKSGKSIYNSYAPNLDEIVLYNLDPTGYVNDNINKLREIEQEMGDGYISSILFRSFGETSDYGFQDEVDTSNIDESNAYFLEMIDKIVKLLNTKIKYANEDDKTHYKSILIKLNTLNK